MDFESIKTPQELLDYMSNNIKYCSVGKDNKIYNNLDSSEWVDKCIVQTGEQVLNTKAGTCWDQVELERLWFEKNNYEIKTIFMWFEVNYENNYPTHTFLLYKQDNKWYWFENAFFSSRGIHKFNSVEEATQCVKQKQLEYAISIGVAKEEDLKLIKCYEYPKLERALSIDEYLDHVTVNVDKS